ncbi:hypothetical protein [Occallatibacter savannae]|uniref:hypothetical protein n=1 Tax=Occallatibacter savannae TaxID=1002691 RepID=UPI000D69939E|nr:hypothetical protein [Occallatibacter savannae]
MGSRSHAVWFRLVFFSFALLPCFASPSNSKLLWLVPPGAQIVAGFENYKDEHHHGQLLLTTRNNRLDLADWQSIAGVDLRCSYQEVIEVASSAQGGELTEHLLLVAGKFDREAIFRSLRGRGAKETQYQGHTVVLLEPFTRERGIMKGTRWLVILDDSIALFGTPPSVIAAMNRYAQHADVDAVLRERLTQLPVDVSSWNVLSSLAKAPTQYVASRASDPWARVLAGANVVMVGVRFGGKIRVHFALHANENRGAEFFAQKAISFAEVFARERTGISRPPRMAGVEFGPDRVQGSIQLSRKQFDAWSEWTNNFGHPPAVPERQIAAGQ